MDLILTLLWRYKMDNYWLSEACNTQAKLDHAQTKIAQLEAFVNEIKSLTVTHDVIACTNGNRYASVSPKKIHDVIRKIEPDWRKDKE
jgi:hypothetical protein